MQPVLAAVAPPRRTPLANRYITDTSARSDHAAFTLASRLHEAKFGPLDAATVAAECLDHMGAGIDTTGDALCFILWELSGPRSRRFQDRLRAELRDFVEAGGVDGSASFDRLPFLDAVVQEGLRCFPAIPMSLPRYVPYPSSATADCKVIDGFEMPPGTIVSCQAYSVHRVDVEDVFPAPDTFDPERWLADGSGDGAAEVERRKRLQFAFSNGGRGCIGKQ